MKTPAKPKASMAQISNRVKAAHAEADKMPTVRLNIELSDELMHTLKVRVAQDRVRTLIESLQADGLSEEEIHRLFEAALFFASPVREQIPR